MAISFELHAEQRETAGKGASRRLRQADKVPGIMYGGGEPAVPLTFEHNQLKKALENEAFYSHILTIHIDGKKHQAVLKALQRHPYKPRVTHLDLLRVTGKEKITMTIPLHFIGGDKAPGAQPEIGGVVSHVLSNVEIRCLPANLPEYIEVDISHLELDQSIHLSELKLPKGIELVALVHHDDRPVVTVHIPRVEVEPVVEETGAPTAAEVPAMNVKSDAEVAAAAPAEKGKKE